MDTSIALHLAGILTSLTVFFLVLKNASGNVLASPAFERVCSGSNTGPALLVISQDRGCQERMKNLAEFYGWDLLLCPTCKSAAALPESASIPIVVCDTDRLDMNWRDAFQLFLNADRSRCVVLCTQSDDNRLWQEVIRFGGYDLIRKPIHEEQIVRTIQFAWAFWKTVHVRFRGGAA